MISKLFKPESPWWPTLFYLTFICILHNLLPITQTWICLFWNQLFFWSFTLSTSLINSFNSHIPDFICLWHLFYIYKSTRYLKSLQSLFKAKVQFDVIIFRYKLKKISRSRYCSNKFTSITVTWICCIYFEF